MPSRTFYPDADPETSSVDGSVWHIENTDWASLRAAAGNFYTDDDDGSVYEMVGIGSYTDSNVWNRIVRGILLFDTSLLPKDCTILSAILSVYTNFKRDGLNLGDTFKVNVYGSSPASNVGLANGDFDSLGSTPLCDTPITYSGFTVDERQEFALNAAGLALVSKTGLTKLGLREVTYDVGGATPTWVRFVRNQIMIYLAEKGGDYRPKLVVTYVGGQQHIALS